MRKLTLATTIGLLAASAIFTGCASRDGGYTTAPKATSTLSFSPVTNADELVKWGQDFNLRSIERYHFVVPATLPSADRDALAMDRRDAWERDDLFAETMPPGAEFREPAGAQPERVIIHAPFQR